MLNPSFSLSLFPRIEFGSGAIKLLPEKIALYGRRILIITGSHSFYQTAAWEQLISDLKKNQIQWFHTTVSGEPSAEFIDANVRKFFFSILRSITAA